jgi:hypothetical protein
MVEQELVKLQEQLRIIKEMGWIRNRRSGNVGGVGNTLEDLLEIAENNHQLPDFGLWELKSQRSNTASLLTLFHSEPKPRAARIVPSILLPKYGWAHQEAGSRYSDNERSFRQTISANGYSDRGFKVSIDYPANKVLISFDFSKIDNRHAEWKSNIQQNIGTNIIEPTPFWTFSEIEEKLNNKLKNLMYVSAKTKIIDGSEYFLYDQIQAFIGPSIEKFLSLLEEGALYVDFDARTGHNHGTKFRIRSIRKCDLYKRHISV